MCKEFEENIECRGCLVLIISIALLLVSNIFVYIQLQYYSYYHGQLIHVNSTEIN